MASFELDGREYELLTFDRLDAFTLGDLTILEEHGGLDLSALSEGDVRITSRLVRALMLLSMLKVNPDAVFADTARISMGVLASLGEAVSNTSDEEEPPPPTLVVADVGVPQ